MKVLESVFDMISRGVKEGKDDFHTMIFSNIQNGRVESRCVILRDFDKENKNFSDSPVDEIIKDKQNILLILIWLLIVIKS